MDRENIKKLSLICAGVALFVVVLTVIGMKKAGPKGVGKPYLREQR